MNDALHWNSIAPSYDREIFNVFQNDKKKKLKKYLSRYANKENIAIDFGCGVGRLTRALGRYFIQRHGVDIAPSMIELANQFNRYPERCCYYVNACAALTLLEDDMFDFIYFNLVLQHLRPQYSKAYIKEFIRMLAPEGMLVFQMPAGLRPIHAPFAAQRSTAVGRLSESSCRAEITLLTPLGAREMASQVMLPIRVRNIGDGV